MLYSVHFGKNGEAFHFLRYVVLIGFDKGRCAYRNKQGFRSVMEESVAATAQRFDVEVLGIKHYQAYLQFSFRGHPDMNLHHFVTEVQGKAEKRVKTEYDDGRPLWHGAYMITDTPLATHYGKHSESNPRKSFSEYLTSPRTKQEAQEHVLKPEDTTVGYACEEMFPEGLFGSKKDD